MDNTISRSTMKKMLWTLTTVITLPIFVIIILIFALYRQLINAILYLKYGSHFGGVLNVYDAVHAVKDSEKNPVCVLFIIQYIPKRSESFYDIAHRELSEKIFLKSRQNPKALAILRKYLGYPYLLNNAVASNDCLKKMRIINCPAGEIDKKDLIKLVGEYSYDPLPKNGEALWDVSIGTQPVKWRKDVSNDVVFYPVILRFHHVLGDGESIVKAVLGNFADKIELSKRLKFDNSNIKRKSSIFGIFTQTRNHLKYYLKQLCILCISPSVILGQFLRIRDDSNILHGCQLTNQRVFAVKVEEFPYYIQVTKRIKSRFPGYSFLDVLLTAISASLNEYFVKNSVQAPSYLTVGIPESPRTVKLSTITPNSQLSQGYCSNNLSYSLHKLRINCGNVNISLIKRMKLIKKTGSNFRSSLEVEVGHWLQTVLFGLLPESFSNFIMRLTHVSVIISNLPGPPSISVFDGCQVQDMVPFGAHRERIGVNFVVFTYDGRLQLTLAVDKALMSEEQQVQKILDNVYKYLDLLDRESSKLK